MAGPAIRYFELSRELHQAGHAVTLATPGPTDIAVRDFPIVNYANRSMRDLTAGMDVVLFQGWAMESYPYLRQIDTCLVADLYGPFLLELLVERHHHDDPERLTDPHGTLLVINEQLRRCDYFICASEKQMDFWLGSLMAMGRINTETYTQDPTLRSLVGIVPFGMPSEPPAKVAPAFRGVIPGIGPDDLVLLWGSTVYNWFDPLTLIKGVALAAARHPDLRLVFMATRHPNPMVVAESSMLRRARDLASDLGLTGKHVFFNEGWVPYGRRADWLLEADVGVSINPEHIEARFSYRTRFLDYFWAGLPVICTQGDSLADIVSQEGLGTAVPVGDEVAIARAIDELAQPEKRAIQSEKVRAYASRMTWRHAAEPLLRYCESPRRAADLGSGPGRSASRVPLRLRDVSDRAFDLRYLTSRAVDIALYEGPWSLVSRGLASSRRRLTWRRLLAHDDKSTRSQGSGSRPAEPGGD